MSWRNTFRTPRKQLSGIPRQVGIFQEESFRNNLGGISECIPGGICGRFPGETPLGISEETLR